MQNPDIARLRLQQQGLAQPGFTTPGAVVTHLAAVQAQDYAGARWALGLRMHGASDASIDRAFANGELLRTHVLRPTWHFVAPQDLRWLLQLSGPRVHAANASMYRQLALDRSLFRKSHKLLEKALQGGQQLTRAELAAALVQAGITADGPRLGYIMMSAELDGLICSGARRGKQFTYALLEERIPPAEARSRESALAELVRRYFATRGPATLADFAWWSGLTLAETRTGLEMVASALQQVELNGQRYWFQEAPLGAAATSPQAWLLPNYDEYFIGLKDRSAIGQRAGTGQRLAESLSFLAHILILDGQVIGGWRRTLEKDRVSVNLDPVVTLSRAEKAAVAEAAERYSQFLALKLELTWQK